MSHNTKTKDSERKEAMNLDTELTKFTNYPTLAPELRQHALTYLESPTLLNYSQCSKIANLEVQPLNTNPPKELVLYEGDDGITVFIKYGAMQNYQNSVSKKFGFSDKTMDDIRAHLLKYYKYSKNRRTDIMRIFMKTWPIELLELEHLSEIADWRVTMFPSMYDGFMSYIESCRNCVKKLCLRMPNIRFQDPNAVKITIGKEFFKSTFFKDLPEADLSSVHCDIDETDFMEAKHQNLEMMTSTISFDAIQAKVDKMNNTHYSKDSTICITLPSDDNRNFRYSAFFPYTFLPPHIYGLHCTSIGKVKVIYYNPGKSLSLAKMKDD